MKWLTILLFLNSTAQAGFSEIPASNRYQYKKPAPKKVERRTVRKSKKSELDALDHRNGQRNVVENPNLAPSKI